MNSDRKNAWPGWETVRLIGRGSFGAVYEIQRKLFEDEDEVEKAALKVISIPQNDSNIEEMYNDGYDEESVTSNFKSHLKSIVAEYSLMRKMNGCTNIVNCDDVRYVQHDDGIGWDIFIKMELLTPLTRALPAQVSEETVIKIAKDICIALELCKKYEIVHRDIKPQNIFVSDNGDYKLGDFGIAKTVEKTMGGTKIGTYKYMAPEVYNNQPYGSGADIYSLGLVLYWLLNERRMPFLPLPPAKLSAGMDEAARTRRLSGEKIPAPKNGSQELKEIVLKACAYDPKDRYQSAREMLEALNGMGNRGPVPVENRNSSVPENRQREEEYSDEQATVGIGLEKAERKQNSAQEDAERTVGPDFRKQWEDTEKTIGSLFANKAAAEVIEEKTVGPIFNQTPVDKTADQEKTVGSVFAPKEKPQQPKKKNLLWCVLVTCLALVVVATLLWPKGDVTRTDTEISEDPWVCVRESIVDNGHVIQVYEYEYDAAGNQIKCLQYEKGVKLLGWSESAYNAEGDEVKRTGYAADGILMSLLKYEYDSEGNQIKQSRYSADGTLSEWVEYEYNSEGHQIKQSGYSADGMLTSWFEYEYDSAGNQIKFTIYNADGTLSDLWEFEYDAAGNPTKYTIYGAAGEVYCSGDYQYDSAGNCVIQNVYSSDNTLVRIIEREYARLSEVLQAQEESRTMQTESDQYKAAEALLAEGDTVHAAMAFGKLGDYQDARQRSFALWDNVARNTISEGNSSTIGLKSDGTVVAAGYNGFGQCDVSAWRDIVAVSAGDASIGLKSDGTVVAVGNNEYGQCDVSAWRDIVAVSAGEIFTMGLKSDGTVVAVGNNEYGQCDVSGWREIQVPDEVK